MMRENYIFGCWIGLAAVGSPADAGEIRGRIRIASPTIPVAEGNQAR